ncbi:MAG: acyl-CoA thioesterase [Muribaculaceae bacterium]|nr:acyl-CoA thioesterase [Muribaculaceae bacterium]MDE7111522.1 acyl-CoA thioesterase [Muribaculaceae bacterium]
MSLAKSTLPVPVFSMPFKVRDYEVDSEGIVNNARYLNYMEHTRHEFCASAGLSFARMRQLKMSPVVRRVEIDYLRSLGLGQEFTSCLTLTRKGARFIFRQWILNADGETVVDALITVVNVIDGKPSRGEEFAAAFGAYL